MQHVQVKQTLSDYMRTTPERLKIIDAYLLYILLTGFAQLLYRLLLDWTSPFKTFLSGFISTLTCFALAFFLRLNVKEIEAVKNNDEKKAAVKDVSKNEDIKNEKNAAKDNSENEEIRNEEKVLKENGEDEATEVNDDEDTEENDEKKDVEMNNENKAMDEKDDSAIESNGEKKATKEDDNDKAMEMSEENKSMKDNGKNEVTERKDENKPVKLFDKYKAMFFQISTERAFVEFLIAHAVFHLIVLNFLS
ncbi:unnamed protein product [Cylicocyclus nassatus]|uniref:Dolichyl-diphosphooligosaccharide--protein glycosyltransferase subunit DAD1 n=1 Tax=Cylicocyclus nassatus TaxID=53992 RepID=A0AA36GHE6_CYLNA|nr:unnamed protein product [Cylicocyclus nassatus]CAJ0592692.1 unnamed protein product [Cylicocyclus nassatus]